MKKQLIHSIVAGVSLIALAFFPAKADPPEKVQVQTDREIYIAGESIYYSIRVLTSDSAASNIGYMLLRNTGQVFNQLYLHMEKGKAYGSFTISDTLKTGYYEIVAFTNFMRNGGEDAYYRKQIIVVNRFDDQLDNLVKQGSDKGESFFVEHKAPLMIRLDKDSLSTREEVRLTVKPATSFFNRYYPVVTVSVKQNILSTAGIPREAVSHENEQYAERSDKSLMYPKEKTGIYLDGYITNGDSVPLSNECLYLSTPDTFANLQYAFSDREGRFRFYVPGYYMGKPLFITAKNHKDDCRIVPDDKFRLRSEFRPIPVEMTHELRKYILESQELVRIRKSYQINSTRSIPFRVPPRIPYVYREASAVIYPSHFTRLNDLKEIAGNIVPDLRIREMNGRYLPFVVDYKTRQYFSEPAVIFIDGVPVHDLNPYRKWSSDEISRIELCKAMRVKGEIAFPGVVAIFSNREKKEPGVKQGETPSSVPEVEFPGALSYPMGTFSEYDLYDPPRYPSKISAPVPDFRQLLYWNPNLELNEGSLPVSFYTSDWPSDYIIEVSGYSLEGEPFRVTSKLTVYE